MRVDVLNGLDTAAAERALLACCGSTRWARAMAAARPFASADALHATADAVWSSVDAADWLEAFAAHPRIGAASATAEAESPRSRPRQSEDGVTSRLGWGPNASREWTDEEQSSVAAAADSLLARLAEANREYEARFGCIFIVCATGRTADEMLAILEGRLRNDPATELRTAAEEQRKITHLRLDKL